MVALTGYYNEQILSYVEAISKEFDLINVQTKPSKVADYSFNFYPSNDVLCNAFKDLLSYYKWKHATVFYNSETNLDRIKCLLTGSSKYQQKSEFILKLTKPGDDYKVHLNNTIFERKSRNLIIDLPTKETAKFLKTCLQLGLINQSYSYIITSLVIYFYQKKIFLFLNLVLIYRILNL
jgi:hypothetical protein